MGFTTKDPSEEQDANPDTNKADFVATPEPEIVPVTAEIVQPKKARGVVSSMSMNPIDVLKGVADQLERVADALERSNHLLDVVLPKTVTVRNNMEVTLSKAQNFSELLNSMEAETTRIGTAYDEIFSKLQAGGLTPEEEDAVFARGTALNNRLKEIGKNPDQPIPPVDPQTA